MEKKGVEKTVLAHATAKAFKLCQGDRVRVETPRGGQCSDLTFETFSALMTADTNKHVLGRKRPTFEITCGLSLYDNASSPILKMIENRSRSAHTMLLPGCRKEIFDGKKKGCLDLISDALGLPRERVPSCVSFFFDLEDGEVIPSTAEQGDYVRPRSTERRDRRHNVLSSRGRSMVHKRSGKLCIICRNKNT